MTAQAITDPYGGEENNPSAIYMALMFNTDALDLLATKYDENVLHDQKLVNLSLANRWDDPRFDAKRLLGELLGLLMSVGADRDERVREIMDIAQAELRARA